MELIDFCKVMAAKASTINEKKNVLAKAIAKHNRLMDEAKKGQGCDRHLFGIMCAAFESNLPVPELFNDPAFTKSGGNGNFILSTSTCGYTGMSGGVAPMCADGYGCFYNFEPDKIWLWITAFRESYKTSVEKFDRSLEQAFMDVHAVLISPDFKL